MDSMSSVRFIFPSTKSFYPYTCILFEIFFSVTKSNKRLKNVSVYLESQYMMLAFVRVCNNKIINSYR